MTNKEVVSNSDKITNAVISDIKLLVEKSKQEVAITVNSTMTELYWNIGYRIKIEILHKNRAKYGKQIIPSIAKRLTVEYGTSFSEKNLRRMVQFAEVFTDKKIVATLWRQLSWSHFKLLIPINEPIRRDFYIEICKLERWSTRTLGARINSMLFERTAISKKPEETIKNDLILLNNRYTKS